MASSANILILRQISAIAYLKCIAQSETWTHVARLCPTVDVDAMEDNTHSQVAFNSGAKF